MVLQQKLQPRERGVAVYKNSEFLGYEDIVTLSDKQFAEEAERKVMDNVDTLIDEITNLAQAKIFLKRLCKRLNKNGLLP